MRAPTLAELEAPPEISPPPVMRALLRPRLALQLARAMLWICAALAAVSAAMLPGLGPASAPLPWLMAGLAALGAAATRLPAQAWAPALTAIAIGLNLALAACAFGLGLGLDTPGLPVCGVLVCAVGAAAGWRSGSLVAAVAAAALLAVAAGGGGAQPSTLPVPGALLTDLIVLVAGLAFGVVIAQVLGRSLHAAQEREDRFRRLLALAADAYWEIDKDYRLVAAADHAGTLHPSSGAASSLGIPPWSMPEFDCDPETLDGIQADLDTRMPFRDQPVSWLADDERPRSLLVSGEPRFDRRGIFTGYWGVARDVSAVEDAQAALEATETRYEDLFTHLPTPLVLHREGRIIDANPAALKLLGQRELQLIVGTDLLANLIDESSRERARRRIEALQLQPVGHALPVVDYRLLVRDRLISVRTTAVRVESPGGPATLTMFVDDSERLAAEQAVRRSEAMLSHLFATSPDLITLTEMDSGRYVMVNPSFERISGWAAEEAVGRTSTELGVWESVAAREAFVRQMRDEGSVTDLPVVFVDRDRRSFAMVVSAARFVMDRRDYMVINARDVTEKERERRERDAILRNASVGIAVTRGGIFVLANAHFEQIYGWPSGELVGRPGEVVWANSEELAAIDHEIHPVLARGEPVEIERPGRRKDGSRFLAHIRGRAIDPAQPAQGGTVWIVEDVTERRGFEQTLARARDAAESASRAKSAFLANTSHELRTPLNGMLGLARLAREEGLEPARRRQYLDQIVESAQTLAGIISDILDLSKIEAGKLLIESTPFELGVELRQLHRSFATQATVKGLELGLSVARDTEGPVVGDPLRMSQIVANFLANALKFTERGRIDLRAWRPDGGAVVRLEVQDTGPGIPAATLARLFEPFTQGDESTTRRHGGTGLGLSISRELAGLLGGTVGVESQPARGSTFWAELPLPATAAAPSPPLPSSDQALQGARVLLVEDNPVNMVIATAMLERWGVIVTQANDGLQALDLVAASGDDTPRFDAVLMDVQMPLMSGHEATRALRAMPVGARLPIIALTAAALVSEREEALSAGMNDFLTKPIAPDKLYAALVRWCALRA